MAKQSPQPALIAVTGGGSGGHTSAAAGIIEALWEGGVDRQNVLWIGSVQGVESRVAAQKKIAYQAISSGKLRRYWSKDNFRDVPHIIAGIFQSMRLLRANKPGVVVSTGGYVSLPVVIAARLLGTPIVVHEQTLVPGLANRIGSRFARKVLLTFSESQAHFSGRECLVVGNPLRSELKHLPNPAEAYRRLNLDKSLPLLYVTGGAQGSNALNRVIGDALPLLLPRWQIIHQYGTLPMECDGDYLSSLARLLEVELTNRYHPIPYVESSLSDIFAAASLVISRAGAATVNEIIRLGLAAILIPYPGAADQEQLLLAQMLEKAGAAVHLDQATLTPDELVHCINLLKPTDLQIMRQNARALSLDDVEGRLAEAILNVRKH
ncbi:MAG: undecaprenyldiphospho-muramoylpentapeptide beta-N-acetylglucosaminyltransferase [Chloroflexi bacterium]|nr:undecaprenyldiphospho-muramoylpentapeptide beta-N-acetylglucosaminyltransferase [Chloroflexota bacterium]